MPTNTATFREREAAYGIKRADASSIHPLFRHNLTFS